MAQRDVRGLGRNERCPCGSGRKVKQCCGAERRAKSWAPTAVAIAVGAVIVGALVVGVMSMTGEQPASANRVWSAEHGHWHESGVTH